MRVTVDSELIRNVFFITMINKYEIPGDLVKELASEVESLIKNNEDD